jgi:hypothetical protein
MEIEKEPGAGRVRYGNCTSYEPDAACAVQHNHFDGYDQRYAEHFLSIDTTVMFLAGWNSIFEPMYPQVQRSEYYTGEAARMIPKWFGFDDEIEKWSTGGKLGTKAGRPRASPRRRSGEPLGVGDVLVLNAGECAERDPERV